MEVTVEHKKLGVKATVKTLVQRDLEAFGAVIAKEDLGSGSQRAGANVRAALQAGWFIELEPALTPELVASQPPAIIRLLGGFIETIYREVTEIPPE